MSLHPSVAAVRLAVRRTLADLDPGDTVVVACSGGADSLALLAATVFEATEPSWQVIGATVDHGLQAGSAEHADRVAEQMRSLGVAESVTARVKVEAPGLGPEAAAREARYAVLAEIAERFSARVVLLGHTLDDQAETVLLGLTRGSGGRALSGMRRAFEVYRRPLLDVTRADTETACLAEGIEFWTDPHNADEEFTRVRVRHEGAAAARGGARPRGGRDSRAHGRPAAGGHGVPRRGGGCGAGVGVRGRGAGRLVRVRAGAASRRDPQPGPPARRRTRQAPCRPSCSTPTWSPSTAWSPTGTARSGSSSPATSAVSRSGDLLSFEPQPRD